MLQINPPGLILVLDQVLSQGDSVLRELERLVGRLEDSSRVVKAEQRDLVPEAAWLGLELAGIAEGPLVVAALQVDPPEKSVHFRLDLATVDSQGLVQKAPTAVPADTLADLAQIFPRLNSKRLTVVPGRGFIHGLVWEQGSLDLGTTPLYDAVGKPVHQSCPQGDGDILLRQFIDDSVNILSELEINERRRDQGEPPLNLLWPTGHGFRPSLPNLALRRGAPAMVYSRSLPLAGLAYLAGYRHVWLEGGVFPKLPNLNPGFPCLVVLDGFNRAHEVGKQDRAVEYLMEVFESLIFEPRTKPDPARDTLVIATPWQNAFADSLAWVIGQEIPNRIPFDERVFQDPKTPGQSLARLAAEALTPRATP